MGSVAIAGHDQQICFLCTSNDLLLNTSPADLRSGQAAHSLARFAQQALSGRSRGGVYLYARVLVGVAATEQTRESTVCYR